MSLMQLRVLISFRGQTFILPMGRKQLVDYEYELNLGKVSPMAYKMSTLNF
jgi:hypothetical protein